MGYRLNKKIHVLKAPALPPELESDAQWLAGEGAGSWFMFRVLAENKILIGRYAPDGELECEGEFSTPDGFSVTEDFTITYPSHCQLVSVHQNHRLMTLIRQ